MQNLEKVQQAADYLAERFPEARVPKTAVILGSGLGAVSGALENRLSAPYGDIPGFPVSTVEGHSGCLTMGNLDGVPVWLQEGRFHLYEGYEAADTVMGVRTLATLGVENIIITNAAGCLNPQWDTGSLMLITDHINAFGTSPLSGPNVKEWGVRFPDMSTVYSPSLREIAIAAATENKVPLNRGVYVGVPGPNLETPAETRAFRILGADAVGMSTVLEAVAAKHMGLNILGISCLTNKNLPDCMAETSHEEVVRVAGLASGRMITLLRAVIQGIGHRQ